MMKGYLISSEYSIVVKHVPQHCNHKNISYQIPLQKSRFWMTKDLNVTAK